MERGHREEQFLFAGAELWIYKSGLGAAIPGAGFGCSISSSVLEHHPGSGRKFPPDIAAGLWMCLSFSWTLQASSEPEDCPCIPVDPESLAWTSSPPLTTHTGGCAKGWNKPECDGSSQGTGRKPLSRHRAVGDSFMEVLCLKNCLSSAVIHFNKGRMERNSFPCNSTTATLARVQRESCLQRDKQTNREPAAPLFCARSSKTIPGAVCNQEQNLAAGRAPRETFPVQSWLAF